MSEHRTQRLLLLIITSCFGFSCLVPRDLSDCPSELACGECLNRSGCGYCAEGSGQCIAGTSLGSDDSKGCLVDRWHFASCPIELDSGVDSDTPVVCGNLVSCETCVAREECGYCLNTAQCQEVDDGMCELVLSASNCDGGESICEAATTCSACVAIEGCAFCPDRGDCRPENVEGGCELVTSCDPQTCNDAQTCEQCLGLDCVFCDRDGGYCIENGEELCSPLYSMFPSTGVSCPPPNICHQYESCQSCIGNNGCGWCPLPMGSGFCSAADEEGRDYSRTCWSVDYTVNHCSAW